MDFGSVPHGKKLHIFAHGPWTIPMSGTDEPPKGPRVAARATKICPIHVLGDVLGLDGSGF